MSGKSGALTPELSHIGSTLRNATRDIGEEPLPEEMRVLLALLELSEPDAGQPSENAQKTSDRDPRTLLTSGAWFVSRTDETC